MITLTINNIRVTVEEGISVAAAIARSGVEAFRTSPGGEPRGPLCGMGICFECRVSIDGLSHLRSCNVIARDGMEVVTGE